MRKLVAFGLVGAIIIGAVAGLLLLESGRIPDWQATLQAYLSESAPITGAATVQAVARAERPWNFSSEMTLPVYAGGLLSLEALPPVEELHCVLLKRGHRAQSTATDNRPYEIALVAYHSDTLWNQGWAVHLLRADSPTAVADILAAVGCDAINRRLPAQN